MALDPTQTEEAQEGEVVNRKSRIEEKRALQQEKTNERIDAANKLKLSYGRIKDEPAFLDILEKAKSFITYHERIGKDGVGLRATGTFDNAGNEVMETVYHTGEKRLFEFERANGIQEIVNYMESHVTEKALEQVKSKKVVV